MSEQIDRAVRRLRSGLARLVQDDRGVTAVEYGVIAALIVVTCIAAISAAGTGLLANYYLPVASAVGSAVSR